MATLILAKAYAISRATTSGVRPLVLSITNHRWFWCVVVVMVVVVVVLTVMVVVVVVVVGALGLMFP